MLKIKKFRYIFTFLSLVGTFGFINAAETADQLLKKAASAINSTSGLTAAFTVDYGSQKLSGTLKALGHKFVLETSASSTWYDGKNMWTYNPKTAETTLTVPTPSEVAESNPLSFVNSYSSTFTASYAKTQKAGSKTVVLTPKKKNSGYNSVHITISESTSIPTRIVVVPSSGQKMTVSISGVKRQQKLAPATFVYPKSKYPKAEIVDLR